MNKFILKHESRSMKWILLLSTLVSVFLVIMFSLILDDIYGNMFLNGIEVNQALIQRALRDTSPMILILFTIISVIQVFIQFRTEKDEEIKRFLKSLPIRKEEFFKVKLSTGIINITLAFIVLTIGIIIVRMNNMFWIKDIYSISFISEPFIKADGIASLLKEIGLIYLIILGFYTFLFMWQYTFTNLIGGIATGILSWLAPGFIAYTSLHLLNRFIRIPLFYNFKKLALWLIPWIYSSEYISLWIYDSDGAGMSTSIRSIENLWIKYIICLALIIINIIIGHKFNKNSKVENENMIIPFKITRNIFKIGVTICSGLLVFVILSELMQIKTNNIYIPFILLGGAIGYFISKKITKVGIR